MLRRVALLRTNVSEEPNASIIRVTGIGEPTIKLAVTSNRPTLRRHKRRNIPEDGILQILYRLCPPYLSFSRIYRSSSGRPMKMMNRGFAVFTFLYV
jgi:hypothetical protein